MNTRYIELAIKFLKDYSDVLSNNGCNDWDFPEDWDEGQRNHFIRRYIAFNERRELETVMIEEVEGQDMSDFAVASLLAHLLEP